MKRGLIRGISVGWGQVAWGSSLDDFLQTFPRATQDDDWWLSGEEPGDLAGFAINEVKYAFNPDGQLYLIGLFPNEPSRVMAGFPFVLGSPDEQGTAGWTYGKIRVSLKADGHFVLLTNTAFEEEPVEAVLLNDIADEQNPLDFLNGLGGSPQPEFASLIADEDEQVVEAVLADETTEDENPLAFLDDVGQGPGRPQRALPLPASLAKPKRDCNRCKHRLSRSVCGQIASPFFSQRVEPTQVCAQFEENPAQDYFVAALVWIRQRGPIGRNDGRATTDGN